MSAAPTDLAAFAAAETVKLTRFAYLLCGDRGRAEDLVQDAFVSLYRRFGDELTLAAPVAYARRIIVNANISRSRRRTYQEALFDDVPELAVDAVDHGEQDAMWRLLAGLPERQRTVLVCRYYLDLSDAEIAERSTPAKALCAASPPGPLHTSASTQNSETAHDHRPRPHRGRRPVQPAALDSRRTRRHHHQRT